MKHGICPRCGASWSILHDGTLVEHPQSSNDKVVAFALLCPGSRTRPQSHAELAGPGVPRWQRAGAEPVLPRA